MVVREITLPEGASATELCVVCDPETFTLVYTILPPTPAVPLKARERRNVRPRLPFRDPGASHQDVLLRSGGVRLFNYYIVGMK